MSEKITLRTRANEMVEAGQAGIWIRTHEPEAAIADLQEQGKQKNWQVLVWDTINGVPEIQQQEQQLPQKQSAIAAVNTLKAAGIQRQAEDFDGDTPHILLVLRNGHREIENNGAVNKEMLMAIQECLDIGKGSYCHLVILSYPGIQIPIEVRELFWVIDHELPDADQRARIIQDVVYPDEEHPEIEEKYRELAPLFSGLTRLQVENVAALSLLHHGDILRDVVWTEKAALINKSEALNLYKGDENFDMVGGLAGLKEFAEKALTNTEAPAIARARAFLLLGIPGTGKSAFCKALGNQLGRPTLTLDVGAIMGGIVGETERNTREALRTADAMEPCIVFVDEIEKALGSGGDKDGGVSSRLRGTLLTWLNDHTSDVLFVGTANDVRALPPEFTRAERFDGIFFMDLPSRESKNAIWKIYLRMFGHTLEDVLPDKIPDDEIWTGAEIRACCRLARLLEVPLRDAARQVVPVMMTAKEQIESLRDWANGRCLDAETGLVYTSAKTTPIPKNAAGGSPTKRRIRRKTGSVT